MRPTINQVNDQPVSLDRFLACVKPPRCRSRVLGEPAYQRYCRALSRAADAAERGQAYYQQEVGGSVPAGFGFPAEVSRWCVYVRPLSQVVVQIVDRVRVEPGQRVPPGYDGDYYAAFRASSAARMALDRARGVGV